MIALIGAVFVASLLGSLHCAGMCGAFLAFAVGPPGDRASGGRLHAAYNAGRLTTYTALGALAGLLGGAIDTGGALLGVQRLAAIGAGAVMIGFGVVVLLRTRGVRLPRVPLPMALERTLTAAHRRAAGQTPIVRAGLTGLLTTLLPCGWLYAFVVTAAGTGHPGWGALTMAAFWLGTLPVMIALGVGLRRATGALGRRLPTLTALALVGVGGYTVAQRLRLAPFERPAAITDGGAQIERVTSLKSSDSPCCDADAR